MGLLTPGYWPSTYWAANYWTANYWAHFGIPSSEVLRLNSVIDTSINKNSTINHQLNLTSIMELEAV